MAAAAAATDAGGSRARRENPGAGASLYVGRFAPSPTGDLHLGSLYTAVASYLDARSQGGRWLLRIEDLDRPREVPGAAASIVSTLEAFGFEWDGGIVRQAERTAHYASALEALRARGLIFECSCSRLKLAEEERYPGTVGRGRRSLTRRRLRGCASIPATCNSAIAFKGATGKTSRRRWAT